MNRKTKVTGIYDPKTNTVSKMKVVKETETKVRPPEASAGHKAIRKICIDWGYSLLESTYHAGIKSWVVRVRSNPAGFSFPGERKGYRIVGVNYKGVVEAIKKLPKLTS